MQMLFLSFIFSHNSSSILQGFICIPKSSKKERVISNANVYDFELSDEEMASLDSLDECQSSHLLISVYHTEYFLDLVTDWDPTGCP